MICLTHLEAGLLCGNVVGPPHPRQIFGVSEIINLSSNLVDSLNELGQMVQHIFGKQSKSYHSAYCYSITRIVPHAALDVRLVRVVLLQQPLVLRVQLGRHSLTHLIDLQNNTFVTF